LDINVKFDWSKRKRFKEMKATITIEISDTDDWGDFELSNLTMPEIEEAIKKIMEAELYASNIDFVDVTVRVN